ncbi:MAG TPA: sulfite exporter TauE/SafE family protein [Burkholderiales bacterium]|nr:sulfite exporter TauE/SafE family protein [Burkholderiales bacterium]
MAFAVFSGAVVSGFAGFAFSAVAGAILLHVLPPTEAVPFMMICSLGLQLVAMVSLREHMQWRRAGALIGGGLLGLIPGLWLLQRVDANAFRVGFGVFLTAYAAYMLVRPAWGALREAPARLRDFAIGFAGGVVGGLTAMPGAVPTIWCDLRAVPKSEQRGLLQPYIAAMQIAALAMLVARHGIPQTLLGDLRPALVPLVAGTAVGLALFGKVNERGFRRAVLCALLVSGLGFFAYR